MSAEFRRRHMRVIESNENDVSSQIRMNHGRELEVVDAALDQILQGLDAFAYEKQRPDSRLEDAQMFLAVRSFNSLHIARQLLERGYYQQASVLVRMAMEDQLVAEDAETHPPTLDALLDDKGSISSGDLTYGKMAERISPKPKKRGMRNTDSSAKEPHTHGVEACWHSQLYGGLYSLVVTTMKGKLR